MTPLLLVAFFALLAAAGWAAVLLVKLRDRYGQVLAGLLMLVSVEHLGAIFGPIDFAAADPFIGVAALPSVGAAIALVLTVALLHRISAGHERTWQEYSTEKAYLEELFQNSPEAIVLVDNDSRVLRINRPFTDLFGYTEEELVGHPMDDMLTTGEYRGEAHDITQQITRGEKVTLETVRRRKNGSPVEVSITGVPVRYGGGQVGVFGIYRDMTSRNAIERELRRLQKAVETTQLGVTVTDLDGRIVYVNPAEADMHGWDVEDLIGQDARVFAADKQATPLTPQQLQSLTSWRRETINKRNDGSVFPVQLMSDVVRDVGGAVVGIVTTCEDITRRKAAEAALRASEERYALAARGANDGLWDWEVPSRTAYFSDRWKAILGFGPAEVEGTIDWWLDRVHPEDADRVQEDLDAHLRGDSEHFESEHRVRHKDEAYRWVLVRGLAVRDADGQPQRMAGSITDISAWKRVEETLARDALYDPLTGLPNRSFFTNLLERAVRRVRRRKGYKFAVLFLDLDRFKVVNDSLGHETGDQLLIGVSERLERCLRPGDVVARLAGDEFCILVDDITGGDDAIRIAERVQEEFAAPFQLNGHRIFASASIGIATSDTELGPEHLLRDADTAMYRAKSRGRSRFEMFDQEMHERAMRLLEMESDLRTALDEGQFRLHYLPTVSLATRKVEGFEALVRWEHPQRGTVSPAEFVPIAEETGVMIRLGQWILREACRQMMVWSEAFPGINDLSVSVNLSRHQLQQVDLVEDVERILTETGLDPERLKLEVTETVLMDDPEFSTTVVRRLSKIGVQVQIDDFGTGYSSLSYLNNLHIDTLKIDRSFISSLGHGKRSVVVEAILRLATELGIHVVAEGVETERQLESLNELSCQHGQGFLFSKPLTVEAATQMLEGVTA
jgi:diguanylate cyclase (GGDEF)-like protein/PAS domain S-box-containing protein